MHARDMRDEMRGMGMNERKREGQAMRANGLGQGQKGGQEMQNGSGRVRREICEDEEEMRARDEGTRQEFKMVCTMGDM